MDPVTVIDYHTAGEPFRIVVGGTPDLRGSTVLEKRADALANHDQIRRLVINEPRGHADQYGCFVVEPDDAGAHFGAVFFHKDGYSTACGHGTIAAATWAFDSGRIEATGGRHTIAIDVPSGRVEARIDIAGGRARSVSFVNVPAFVSATGLEVEPAGVATTADISYGGAFYASIDARSLDLTVAPENVERFVALARATKAQLAGHPAVTHPSEPRLSGLYGVIFFEALGARHQRNITVFADGEVDRSPCGSGTSARLALLYAQGRMPIGETLTHDSVIGTRFEAKVLGETELPHGPAVVTEVTGSAHRTGTSTFTLDPWDSLGLGFQLR